MQDLQSTQTPPPRSTTDLFGDPSDPNPPQWLNPTLFYSHDFDPQSYISDLRSFIPLPTLRSELQSHFTSLQHNLIDLINNDYADFVSLTTNLTDIDSYIIRMRAPLFEIKDKISSFRESVNESLSSLTNRLNQRVEAGEAREVLELLLDTFHVVSKVEKLIKELPNVQADSVENGSSLREGQSMLLERIASEMNRLRFYISHAKNMPFIENMEKRIQNATSLLDSSLRICFVDGLESRDVNAIYNCLRAYAAIDNTKNAEETFRLSVVGPLMRKVIPESSKSGAVGESSGNELEEDYVKIKRYIEDDCKFLLDISSIENSGLHVSSFLGNSILKEVHSAIQKGKPVVFSPGRPTVFLKNYKASLDFLAYLEGYCPSRSEVVKFRCEAAYVDFMKQWNVGVYFSLRFQEIAGALDSALSVAGLVTVDSDERKPQDLILKQSASLLECLVSCWRDDVFVVSCSDKFLRLSLQLMSRFSSWLSAGLAARKAGNVGSNTGFEWAISAVPDDLVYVVHDLNCLVEEVCGDYLEHILELLKSCPAEVCDFVKQSILQGGKSLEGLLPTVMSAIIETIVEKSVEDLRQLKGITATYRMTNKPLPVRHSPYVSGVLRPLKEFLEGERAATCLTNETRNDLLQGAALEITRRYNDLASELVSMSRRTESSLQKLRLGAQRRAGASSDVSDHNLSDTDKICMQLFLDIQEYARSLSLLGVDAASIPPYQSLWQCVAPAERQNTISF
ncbi:unnamed protein product [Withania somnifera]